MRLLNNIKTNIITLSFFTLPLLYALCFGANIQAQETVANGLDVVRYDNSVLTFRFTTGVPTLQSAGNGYHILSLASTNGYSRQPGAPMLPQTSTMMALTGRCRYDISIVDTVWESFDLATLAGMPSPVIMPAATARVKSIEPSAALPDPAVYGTDRMQGSPLVKTEELGTMRGSDIIRLVISPIRYNPVQSRVEVCRQMEVTIRFTSCGEKTPVAAESLNPMLNGLPMIVRTAGSDDRKEYHNQLNYSNSPYCYMVVTPKRYHNTLKPFLRWKRQEGYLVEEHYCDGETSEQIRDFLKTRYDSASVEHPAPLFILLVGDVDDIPSWPGRQRIQGIDTHRTDLYYSEFTDDNLPDAILGRLPVNDTAELKEIVKKTVEYERFRLADSSHLRRCLLVAGKENRIPAPTTTNGQVNRLKQAIIDFDSTIDTLCYYNPTSDSLSDDIKRTWESGVGYVNYTAHCKYFGWSHPLINSDYIDTMPTEGHYFLAINNCCRSNAIFGDCFGEHLLRKEGGGAIGVIGATNETLWDEDYYWSVGGNGEPQIDPQYDSLMPGAIDRLLHKHGETPESQAATQGQIVIGGNWAVSASGSPYDAFYWEIYSLLGDPSLMPYIGIPATMSITTDSLAIGDTTVTLHGTAGARVAATWNDTLYGISTIDSSGHASMHLVRPFHGNITFTATAQYRKPVQHSIIMHPEDPIGIHTVEKTQEYNIFPNPSSSSVTIEGFSEPTQILIVDIYGREVANHHVAAHERLILNTDSFHKGIYGIIFYTQQGNRHLTKSTRRLIIK